MEDKEECNSNPWIKVKAKDKHSFSLNSTVISHPPLLPPTNDCITCKGDSGASNHYFVLQECACLENKIPSKSTSSVTLPTLDTIKPILDGDLPLQGLSKQAKCTEIFKRLHHSLISLGQLCNDNCVVVLTKNKLTAAESANVQLTNIVLQGKRNNTNKLWDILLPQNQPSPATCYCLDIIAPLQAHQKPTLIAPTISPTNVPKSLDVIIQKDKTKHDLVHYLHAVCFSPPSSTFINVIKKPHLISWQGLTVNLASKFLLQTVHFVKGHIKQEQQGLQSTKQLEYEPLDMHPQSDTPNVKTKDVIYALISTSDKGFMDLTGHFPYCSSRGNKYILIVYHYNSNAILGHALPNRQAGTITKGWKSIFSDLQQAGVAPNLWILDNETSQHLQQAMSKQKNKYRLVPSNNHCSNTAEQGIQTFKYHFKSDLSSVEDLNFPIAE